MANPIGIANAKFRLVKAKTLILFLGLAWTLPLAARAQVNYVVAGNTAYVTSSPNASGNVVIPSAYNGRPVTSIDAWAFAICSNLTSIAIPAGVISIGNDAFSYCTSLTNITVATNNPDYSSINGVLFDKNQTTLIQFPAGYVVSYVIPNSVTNIGDDAFSDASLTSITIPNSVTRIGYHEFRYCSNLTNAVIGNGVTTISDSAFEACINLTSVTIPDSVTSIEEDAFYRCAGLTNVTIGANVKSISTWVFEDCVNLASVIFPNGIASIGAGAFVDCASLTSVTIPDSVTNIGFEPFFYCVKLTNITVVADNPAYSSSNGVLFDKNQTLLIQFPTGFVGNYVIPNSVTNIDYGAFAGCSGLMNLVIPGSVTSLMEYEFDSCLSLTNITFLGNAPDPGYDPFDSVPGTVYYYYGTSGWGATYAGLPTVELAWTPQIVGGASVQSSNFGFTIIGTNGMSIVVEASTNLVDWQPVWTNTLSGASTTSPIRGGQIILPATIGQDKTKRRNANLACNFCRKA